MRLLIFLLGSNLIIPIIMLVFGSVSIKHVPKKINGIYGYRTTMSMKNMDTWHFAHEYFGKLWKRMGFFMLIFSFVLTLVTYQISNGIQAMSSAVIVTLQTVLLIASIFPVEKALNKNFDKQGSRK